MEQLIEINDSIVVNVDDIDEMDIAVAEALENNNELASNRFFENLEIRDENIIRLTVEFNKKHFDINGLSNKELRNYLLQKIELADTLLISVVERDQNNNINDRNIINSEE